MMYKIKYGFYGNAYVEDTKTVMEHLLRTRSKAMSERVSDEALAGIAGLPQDCDTPRLRLIARELLERRALGAHHEQLDAELERWKALGESPEAVRAELMRVEQLRADLDEARGRPRWTANQIDAVKNEVGNLRDKIARPSFAEAFEDACRGYALRSSKSMGDREAAVTLWELVKEARLASRDGVE